MIQYNSVLPPKFVTILSNKCVTNLFCVEQHGTKNLRLKTKTIPFNAVQLRRYAIQCKYRECNKEYIQVPTGKMRRTVDRQTTGREMKRHIKKELNPNSEANIAH